MIRKGSWQPCYAFFLLLLVHTLILGDTFFKAFAKSYVIYLFLGGWRYQRLFALCVRRDLKGLRVLLLVLYDTYWNSFFKETFRDMFDRTVRKVGKDAIAFYFEDQVWTFGHLDAYSNKVANYLVKCGLKRGDKLFLLMHSSPSYVGIWLGAAKIGVATALLNYNLRKDSLAHSLGAVDASAIVVGSRLKDAFVEVGGEQKFDKDKVWYVDESASIPDSAYAMTSTCACEWNRALAQVSSAAPPPLSKAISPHEHLIYVYTSGTSGLPKAAIITIPRYILMVDGCRFPFSISRSDVLYSSLPLYHTMAGICGLGQVLLHGTPMVIRTKFSASQFWTDCIKYKCTVIQYIGETCRYLIAQPPKSTDTQHHVRLAFGNGLRRDTWIEFQKRFNIPQIMELYGATESSACIINPDNTVGAIGFLPQVIRNVYPIFLIKMDPVTEEPIRDPNTGLCMECEPYETGQLVGKIRKGSPIHRFDGYVNKEASMKRILRNVFDQGDVWFGSGDLMYCDELGYLYFSDRMGDTFRWHGENVSTAEVENVVSKILGKSLVTVYGVPLPKNEGKAGMAAVRLDMENLSVAEEKALVANIQRVTSDHLPTYARPIFIRFCKDISMTSTFKPCKYEMALRGFDPTKTEDHIYFLDPTSHSYRLVDKDLFCQINSGSLRL
ncbi:unnamed protein product [Calicophoron daubneyi]|uniref:Very long-chain fatty acid transport protein n=1 Tax=Calicophoron daubneyi TaxID=300641 RepID=A0AAV2T9M1_CALDB